MCCIRTFLIIMNDDKKLWFSRIFRVGPVHKWIENHLKNHKNYNDEIPTIMISHPIPILCERCIIIIISCNVAYRQTGRLTTCRGPSL